MIRLLPAAIELIGLALIVGCVYLIEPLLLIGLAGLLVVAVGNAVDRSLEKR